VSKRLISVKPIRLIACFSLFFIAACSNNTEQKATPTTTNDTTKTITEKTENFVEQYSNGQVRIEGKMENGKRVGVWKSYYENGALWSTGMYVDGKRQGLGVVLYNNGKKYMEGEYLDDHRAGKWFFYNERGELIKEENFN